MSSDPSRWPPGYAPGPRLHVFEVRGSDGRDRLAHLLLPDESTADVPLVLSPHPFGLTSLINLFGARPGTSTVVALEGLSEAAAAAGVAVLSIESEGRSYRGASLGWRPHLESYFEAAQRAVEAGHSLDLDAVGAVGLSMGGMEALLLAALWPTRVRAVAVQNAVIDLPGWHADLLAAGRGDVVDTINSEVGGDPSEVPDLYAARSPMAHFRGLSTVSMQIRYSRLDTVVRPESQVLSAVRTGLVPLSQVVEETRPDLNPVDLGRSAHEYINWRSCFEHVLTALERP